jgi:hypothetical protein
VGNEPGEARLAQELLGWLGRGVDLFQFDPFAAVKSSKPATILSEPIPSDKQPLRSYGYEEIYADSLLQMTHKLIVEAGVKGSYGGFSGSVNSKFGLTEKRTEKRHLLKICYVVSGESHNITKDKEALKKMLNDDFKTALANWDADDLLDTYGTHLIRKMIIGGRAEYFCQSSDISSISERDFKICAKAKYKAAGGSLQGTSDVETYDKEKLRLLTGSESIAVIGGSAEAAIKLKDGKWDKWARSCDKLPGFLGFDKQDGLLPIWDLAANADRRKEIHEAYKRRAATALRTEIVSFTSNVSYKPDARVTIPEGYKLLSGGAKDTWTGAGNMLTASFPESDNTWRASGHDLHVRDDARITAYAVALYDPEDIWEVKIFKSTSDAGFTQMKETAVDPGYVMVGGGAQVHYDGVDPHLLFASYPMNKTTWRAHEKEHWYEKPPARITAYAIGLRCKVTGVTVQSEIRETASGHESGRPTAEAGPASGYVMTGGGAALNFVGRNMGDRGSWLTQGLLLTASYPTPDNTWYGAAKDHHYGDRTNIQVLCIGVKVVDNKKAQGE